MMSEIPYATIAVHGKDAFEFLQGQLTANLEDLDGSALHSDHSDQSDRVSVPNSILSAWCNPKGRVICVMSVLANNGGKDYLLTLPEELAGNVVQRMLMFRFRAKVAFDVEKASADQLGIEHSVDDWLLHRLRAGRAEVWLPQSEKFTPHMLNLDLLGTISLDKGCYTGQEVVARTHYRGASKRRCLRFVANQTVEPGDKVSDGQRDVGEVVNAIGKDLLAVVPIAKADESLTVNGVPLEHVPLPYL